MAGQTCCDGGLLQYLRERSLEGHIQQCNGRFAAAIDRLLVELLRWPLLAEIVFCKVSLKLFPELCAACAVH